METKPTRLAMEYEGTIKNGVVVIENGAALPEGTRVRVVPVTEVLRETLGQRLLRFSGTAKGLPPDMARNHDHYLHGAPKR
jgi:hypothetical protein